MTRTVATLHAISDRDVDAVSERAVAGAVEPGVCFHEAVAAFEVVVSGASYHVSAYAGAGYRGGEFMSELMGAILDPASMLNRALDFARNLTFENMLLRLGLDPNHLTSDAVFHRLMEIALAHITLANMLALTGATLYVATLMVRTIVPLRVIGIISMLFFIGYGAVAGAVTTLLLYMLSLPINVVRLRQMLSLIKKARISAQGDLSMDWLRPYMSPRKYRSGDELFRKGDEAREMFLTVTGKFLVTEINIELPPGRFMGELGFVAPGNRRTQTIKCTEDGEVLTITYDKLLELYFQNPEFGYYFLRLTSERLLQNITRLEAIIAANKP